METSNTIRVAVLGSAAVLLLGAAEECGASSGSGVGGGDLACNAGIDQTPRVIDLGGTSAVEAVIHTFCRERQQRHSVKVALWYQDESQGWVQVHTITDDTVPTPGKARKIPISTTECRDGRWQVRYFVSGTSRAGKRFRYPDKGENKNRLGSRIRCSR
ncbi:hypothetical protein SMC26_29520 [Actinomadura fulvescens]|uniref:Secreted protein n=1 Tax=Actinomadura fulvescens TaxID=46160 RepID=A0ABN3QKP1_9ACTN